MNEYQTGAVRDTGGKGRMDLLPWSAIMRISKHMEDAILPDPQTGVPHYPERNWEKGLPIHSMIDSAFRHLAKYAEGWDDEDHLCAAATNLLMAMWMEEHKPEMQDIPSRRHGEVSSLASGTEGGRTPADDNRDQERPKETQGELCSCYDEGRERCLGTREKDSCTCKGNEKDCDFYEEKKQS